MLVADWHSKEYIAGLRKEGLQIGSMVIVARLTSIDDEVFNAEIDRIAFALKRCFEIGCDNVLIVPNNIEDAKAHKYKSSALKRMVEGLRIVVKQAEEYGIAVNIENYSSRELPFSTMQDLKKVFEQVPGLYYTYDTGNFVCIDEDPIEAYNLLKPYIYMFHVKDFDFTNREVGFLRPDGRRLFGCKYGSGKARLDEILRIASVDFPNARYLVEYSNNEIGCAELRQAADFIKYYNG